MYEKNLFIKDWRTIDISFGLIYPNIYNVGMSSYSIRLLYYLINQYENIACERIFLPENIKFPASKDFSDENNIRSLENHFLPSEFDILGFSIQFENDFKNILWILEKAKIPLKAEKRQQLREKEFKEFPLIIGGGPVSTSNPLPLSRIFDLFFIGDAEPNLEKFFQKFLQYRNSNLKFKKFLTNLEEIQGLFIPSIGNSINRTIFQDLDQFPIPHSQLRVESKDGDVFEESFFLELNRGCPFKCKFCISSFHNTPFRNRSYTNIRNSFNEALNHDDFNSVALIGSCASAHPKFQEICKFIVENEKRLMIPSIRIEHINNKTIEILEKGGIRTITIAPETGSEDLRFKLNKRITNEQILSKVKRIKKSKIKNIKMYFLLGLPDETNEDMRNIADMIRKFDEMEFPKKSLRISVNPLIPKLNTPYEKKIDNYLEGNLGNILEKFEILQKELKNLYSVELKIKNPKNLIKNARLQTLFSLGDKKVSDLLLEYYKNGANFGSLNRAENDLEFSITEYFEKIRDCYKPWIIE